jgi:hypothetical protein
MKAKAVPVSSEPDARGTKVPDRALLPDDDGELTDEEAFYLAQDVAFAEWRAHNEARPRRKLL